MNLPKDSNNLCYFKDWFMRVSEPDFPTAVWNLSPLVVKKEEEDSSSPLTDPPTLWDILSANCLLEIPEFVPLQSLPQVLVSILSLFLAFEFLQM